MEKSFGAMLRQLPNKTEVPNLLVDISQTGLGAGLDEKLFQPQGEARKDFYAELPISIRLTGDYHQMGNFVERNGRAAAHRHVARHRDHAGRRQRQGLSAGDLVLNVTAKTYRYLDEDEQAPADADKARRSPARRRPARAASPRRARAGEAAMADQMTTVLRVVAVTAVLSAVAGCSDDTDRAAREDRRRSRAGRAGGSSRCREVKPYEIFAYPAC